MFDDPDHVMALLQQGFAGTRMLVVGDMMLDRYLSGHILRISPEAPVPVVHVQQEMERGGGSANVALNLAALGLRPALAGLVGDDPEGRALLRLLADAGVDTSPVVTLPDWPTITKTRIMGGQQRQQIVRLDREAPLASDPARYIGQLLQNIHRYMQQESPAAIILSDYAKGVLGETVCQGIIAQARQHGVPVLVDPKGTRYTKYRGATALSPNRAELAVATALPIETPLDELLSAAAGLREEIGVDFLTVTLSEQGVALVESDIDIQRIPTMAREVFDVSGAGDTVISTMAAGLACGLSRMDALHLANMAASVVVARVGTVPVDRTELIAVVSAVQDVTRTGKICSQERARIQIETWRSRGERVVFTNGCFDLLHAGHVDYLAAARRCGRRLVVGLNTDASVRRLKGPTRPIVGEQERARVMAALEMVDLVVLFDEETPLQLIMTLHPDVLAKGADYRMDQVVGATEVQQWGGEVVLVPLVPGQSTSRIVAGIQAMGSDTV